LWVKNHVIVVKSTHDNDFCFRARAAAGRLSCVAHQCQLASGWLQAWPLVLTEPGPGPVYEPGDWAERMRRHHDEHPRTYGPVPVPIPV